MSQVIVYGSGFSAMAALQALKSRSINVAWVRPTRDTALPLLPHLSSEETPSPWIQSLFDPLALFVREDVLRAFHPKGLGPFEGTTYPPEALLSPDKQWMGEPCLMELESAWEQETSINQQLLQCEKTDDGWLLHLADGTLLVASRLVLAENKRKLREVQGLPRLPNFEAHSVIQLRVQHHERALRLECPLQFCSKLIRPEKKEPPRQIWGYFGSGKQSRWSLLISEEERDHYPLIGKLIRRMRASLERMFRDISWEGSSRVGWSANVLNEQIRIEEDALTLEAIQTKPTSQLCVLHPESSLETQLKCLEGWYRAEVGDLPILPQTEALSEAPTQANTSCLPPGPL